MGNDDRNWAIVFCDLANGNLSVCTGPTHSPTLATCSSLSADYIYLGTPQGELVQFALKTLTVTRNSYLGTLSAPPNQPIIPMPPGVFPQGNIQGLLRSLSIMQICVCSDLGKVFTLAGQNYVRVHRSDTLEELCSLNVHADRIYVAREGLGADIELLSSYGQIAKARYEEKVVNRTATFTLSLIHNVIYYANAQINDMSRNNHIITLAVSDGHIHVIDAKTYGSRYVRPGGSMNPANQPKSFVANQSKPGFSLAWVDETKVVGVLGNLMRVFNYEID